MGAHEGLPFLLQKILTPPTPRVLRTAESREGVGWESRRERTGRAERGSPLWILHCGFGWGVESKSPPPWWRGGFQAVCHGLWEKVVLGFGGDPGLLESLGSLCDMTLGLGKGFTQIGGPQFIQIYLSEFICFLLQG